MGVKKVFGGHFFVDVDISVSAKFSPTKNLSYESFDVIETDFVFKAV